jgi:hypothetical protein
VEGASLTREERWLRAELKLVDGDNSGYPERLRKHYERRAEMLRSILQIVLHAQEYDRWTRRSRRARAKLPIAVRRERIRDRNARVLV